MSTITSRYLTPEDLAGKLEQDICRRGLSLDEKYLSTRQVQEQFNVSLTMAAQAMKLMADEDKLVRRNRSGTYVGPGVKGISRRPIKVVYVLMPEERANLSAVPLDLLIESLSSSPAAKPDEKPQQYSVQFTFLPKEGDVQHLKDLMEPMESNWELCGVVAISCSREIYRYLYREGLPVVVLGSLDHDMQDLASIDADHFESGRLIAQYLIEKGHKKISLLGISNGRPGDHEFLDGIAEAMTVAGMPPNALSARLCPYDLDSLRIQAEVTLAPHTRATGVICRGERMVNLILPIISQLGLTVPDDLELVYETFSTSRVENVVYPRVQTSKSFEKIARQIGDMLDGLLSGNALESKHVKIPVEIRKATSHPY